MKFSLTVEERANVYMFLGGLTYVPGLNRENKRKLARLAQKFKISGDAEAFRNTAIELNQNYLNYLLTLLKGAVINGDKAKINPEVTDEQRANIDKVNLTFNAILSKFNVGVTGQ